MLKDKRARAAAKQANCPQPANGQPTSRDTAQRMPVVPLTPRWPLPQPSADRLNLEARAEGQYPIVIGDDVLETFPEQQAVSAARQAMED
jgi:hypothetical protein